METVRERCLNALYWHRLLDTDQLHRMHSPESHPAWVRRQLRELWGDGYVDKIAAFRATAQAAVWFLTPAGVKLAEEGRRSLFGRRYVVNPDQARAKLAHTLAVNEVGLAFLDAARRRPGDQFGYLDWEPEVAHAHPERRVAVIADALVTYVAAEDDEPGGYRFVERFVELDRGTESNKRLREKLRDYHALRRHWVGTRAGDAGPRGRGRTGDTRRWVDRYPDVFPHLVVVFEFGGTDDSARRRAERRMRLAAEACRSSHELLRGDWPILFCLLADLRARGPFEPIFWPLTPRPFDVPVDVLGRAADGAAA